jgi:hypothetical protein|nr:MAG TPA: hypothetical protein [Caudoviricetes sp.]
MEIKRIQDYYDVMCEKFPDIPKKDMIRILNYGWKSLYLHNLYGGDTFISDDSLWCYIGTLRKDSLKHFQHYIKKLVIKLRVLYRRKNIEWDGYYYFALTDTQYENFLAQHNARGRKRKKFNYGNQVLYQIFDECRIKEYNKRYIFRVPFITQVGFTAYRENFASSEAELIVTREPLKFKDVLVDSNKYDYL